MAIERFLLFALHSSLLLTSLVVLPCSSRSTSSFSHHPDFVEDKLGEDVMRIEMVHRDFGNPWMRGMSEKLTAAVKRSLRRLDYFHMSIATAALPNASNNGYSVPVFSMDGSYITSMAFGTPPIRFTAIVDTGSDLIWIECSPCTQCFKDPTSLFDPAKSSTYTHASCKDPLCSALYDKHCSTNSTCQYTYGYGDNSSTTGDLVYDALTINTTIIPHIGFGCAHHTTPQDDDAFSGAAGLVGMGQGPLSLSSQLPHAHKFSYCLVSIQDSTSKTSPMLLGDSATLTGPNVSSTSIITSPVIDTFYYIPLNGISVGGELLDIPQKAFELQSDGHGGTIIDSGTTLMLLVDEAYQSLLKAFKSAIKLPLADGSQVGFDLCYSKPGPVPTLTLHFDGADMNLPTPNYFIQSDDLFCLAIATSQDVSIFGNIPQQNFHFLYDRDAKKLSFAPTPCDQL